MIPIVEKLDSGAYLVSDIINGVRVKKQYMGYTKKEALKLFKEEFYDSRSSDKRE